MTVIVALIAGCPPDVALQAEGAALIGKPFSARHLDGSALTGTVTSAVRRLGRKRGYTAQWIVELS